jgi:phosphoketolase
VLEVTNLCSIAEVITGDEHVWPDARVMEMLSGHQREGWLEDSTCVRWVQRRKARPRHLYDTEVNKNDPGRFDPVADVIDRVPRLGPKAAYAKLAIRDKLIQHGQDIAEHGADLPEI